MKKLTDILGKLFAIALVYVFILGLYVFILGLTWLFGVPPEGFDHVLLFLVLSLGMSITELKKQEE